MYGSSEPAKPKPQQESVKKKPATRPENVRMCFSKHKPPTQLFDLAELTVGVECILAMTLNGLYVLQLKEESRGIFQSFWMGQNRFELLTISPGGSLVGILMDMTSVMKLAKSCWKEM